MSQLDPRLNAVFEFVPPGSRVADIGTDHGYLAIALTLSHRVQSVIACDINAKPLENARRNIERCGAGGITLRLSDGLSGIKSDETDCIVMAGMGGEVIAGIIGKCEYLNTSGHLLILQPMTGAVLLRRFLCENGFTITAERGVCDKRRVYTVIAARYTGERMPDCDIYCWHGKLNPALKDDRAYLEKQRRILKKCRDELALIPERHDAYTEYEALYNGIAGYIDSTELG